MNWLDYALIAVIVIGSLLGTLTSPLWQLYRMFSIILSFASAFFLGKIIGGILEGICSPNISVILGGAIVFFVVLILTYIVGWLFRFLFPKSKFGIRRMVLGGGIGLFKAVFICCIIVYVMTFIRDERIKTIVNGSLIAYNLNRAAQTVISEVSKNIKEGPLTEKKVGDKK